MINTFQTHRLDHFHNDSSFAIGSEGGDVTVLSGDVMRLGKKSISRSGAVVNKPDGNDEGMEVYLHILTKPLSNRIVLVNILNQQEVERQKQNSDDLLNIYLPLSRAEKNDAGQFSEFQANDNIDTNFLWVKENKDKPFACYYDRDKVYITGYLLSHENSSKAKPSIEIAEAAEGKALVLEVVAKINEEKGTGEGFFVLEKYEVNVKDISDCSIEAKEDTIVLNEDGGLPILSGNFFDTLEINYPIGFIDKGNFIHGKLPNNMTIGADYSSTDFFLEESSYPDGCPFAVFSDRRDFYITVS